MATLTIQPSIADLTIRFMNRSEDAEHLAAAADAFGEVEPHEVSVGFRAEPRQAWNEASAVLGAFSPRFTASTNSIPNEWASLVVRHETVAGLAFATGNYPQRVRDLGTLLQADDLKSLLPVRESASLSSALTRWASVQSKGDTAQQILALGVLRGAGDLEGSRKALENLQKSAPAEFQTVLQNEEAAQLWHENQWDAALALWNRLPESVPVLFNRGMASLFLGKTEEARKSLNQVVSQMSENSAWHHLASLYLALAEMRD